MDLKWIFSTAGFIITMYSLTSVVQAGKVLLFPYGHGFNSRLVDMNLFGNLLKAEGHNISYLVNSQDRRHLNQDPDITFHTYPVPENRVALIDDEALKSKLMNEETSSKSILSSLKMLLKRHILLCEELLKRPHILQDIKAEHYDLFMVDIADNCGRVLSIYLEIPTIVYSSTGLVPDKVLFPNLPSIVPAPALPFTSRMSFFERVINFVMYGVIDIFLGPIYITGFEEIREKYGLKNDSAIPLSDAYVKQIFMSNTDYTLEEPRPLLPNVILVGGIHVHGAKPLNPELEKFMDNSGDAGVILVSFGSLVAQMSREKASMIARVLSRFNQSVIWRLKKDQVDPTMLGSNTKLLDWIPQNDILGHPKLKAFVTHCGIHGVYETLNHGVPVIAVPLMFDQYGNAIKLTKTAEMGIQLDFNSMTERTLEEGIKEVITNPRYKENAVYASKMLKDHPITPQKKFLFYADYMMRNKGIGKMRLEQVEHLNSLQLFCVDVIAFLLFVIIFSILLLYLMLVSLWRCFKIFLTLSARQKKIENKKMK